MERRCERHFVRFFWFSLVHRCAWSVFSENSWHTGVLWPCFPGFPSPRQSSARFMEKRHEVRVWSSFSMFRWPTGTLWPGFSDFPWPTVKVAYIFDKTPLREALVELFWVSVEQAHISQVFLSFAGKVLHVSYRKSPESTLSPSFWEFSSLSGKLELMEKAPLSEALAKFPEHLWSADMYALAMFYFKLPRNASKVAYTSWIIDNKYFVDRRGLCEE